MVPDVTILIAAYNAADTIERALRSGLGQRDVSLEIVVVDDCSSDETAKVVRSVGDSRVRLIELAINKGPGGARNVGLAEAKGRYVAILDADDTIHDERMARLVARLDRTAADVVTDNLEVASADAKTKRPMFSSAEFTDYTTISLADYILANRLFRATFNFGYLKPVFRRSFLEKFSLRYPEEIRIGEDYVFLARSLAAGGVCVTEPRIGYTYHVRQGSISRVLKLADVEVMMRADETFLAGHELDAVASAAYRKRSRSLREAWAFLAVVAALKNRSPLTATRHVLRYPAAIRLFHMPIRVRLVRLLEVLKRPSVV